MGPLRTIYKIASKKGELKRKRRKVNEVLLTIGNKIYDLLGPAVAPEPEIPRPKLPTPKVITETIYSLGRENNGDPPTVKKVRKQIKKDYEDLGKERKDFNNWIRDTWFIVVREFHCWLFVSFFTHGRYNAHRMKRNYLYL